MILTTEKVFWKISFNYRRGYGSKTYATPGDQTYPIDFICKACVWLARASEFGRFPLKKKETVVKKFDSFSFHKDLLFMFVVGI
jgi:trehalose utilization protein